MPAAIPYIAAFLFEAGFVSAAIFVATYGAAIVVGAMLIGSLAYSASQRRQAERDARSAYNASQVDRLANVAVTTAPRELVLGRVRKGGNVFFKGSTGANKETFVMLITLAGHEIDGVEQIYLNDVPVTLDSGGWVQDAPYLLVSTGSSFVAGPFVTDGGVSAPAPAAPPEAVAGTVVSTFIADAVENFNPLFGHWITSYQFAIKNPKVRIRSNTGAAGAQADVIVRALFPELWTAAHRAQDTAYLICEFYYDESAFPSGLPQVSALIRGAKVFDPRTSLTVWSENPALMCRHILTQPKFGKRTALTSTETARLIAAANACDTATSYNGAAAVALYRAAIVFPFGTTARDALDDLTQAMGGAWAYAAGEFHIKAGVYQAPVLALGDADLAVVTSGNGASQQPISISAHRARNDKMNVVTPRIWDAAQNYKHVALIPLKGAALIARDGAELVQEVDMQAVFHAPQALHIAGVLLRDSRDPLSVTLPFKLSAYRIEMFDTVSLSLSRFGWVAKQFTVLSRSWSHDGKILLTLKETTAAIFQPDAAFVVGGYASNTALPRPWDIVPPVVVSITSGSAELVRLGDGTVQSRVRVQWVAITDLSITRSGTVEVQWQTPGAAGWTSVVVSGSETQAWLVGVPDGRVILIRLRVRNTLAVSDWGRQQAHTVIGKTDPPPDVGAFLIDGLRLTWTPVSALDLAGYAIRFNYGANSWWTSAAPLHDGLITDTPYAMQRQPAGLVTLLIKAVDSSGNQSLNAAVITANLGSPLVSNLFVSYPQAPTFGGTITNGAVSAGVLQALATDLFYGPDGEPFYGPDTSAYYQPSSYTPMTYSFEIAVGVAGLLLLDHTIAASNFTIEYQRDSQESFYGPDADLFYGADALLFYGAIGLWASWPGSINLTANENIRFMLSTVGGDVQGVISQATPKVDVPDILESFNDLVIAAAGTRLPITRAYRVIENIQITVQANGSGGRTAVIEDKNTTLGPLLKVYDGANAAVLGLVDVDIQGY